MDVERGEPRDAIGEEHHIGIACCTLLNEIDRQPNGQGQQA